jgi:hypothetical protein
MQDVDLYRAILGIEAPWRVDEVRLDTESLEVHVDVSHSEGLRWKCPCCERQLSIHDHVPERQWRHLDTCQYRTWLHARIPRVKCPEHGVKQVHVPWAEPGSRFSLLFEGHAIEVLLACEVITAASDILRISWDQAWNVLERPVGRGQARKQPSVIRHLGVDEKAFRKGHNYVTVVCDISAGTVEYVGDDRSKESLAGYFQGLSSDQRQGIEAVAIDMHEPYVQAIREAACHQGRGQDAPSRAQATVRGWRRFSGQDQIHLDHQSGEPQREAEQDLKGSVPRPPEDRQSLGLQGNAPRPVASRQSGRRHDLFPGLVQARDPRTNRTHEESSTDDQGATSERRQLLPALHHECGCRRPQQQDHVHQAACSWLPQQNQLQGRDFLLLRRP